MTIFPGLAAGNAAATAARISGSDVRLVRLPPDSSRSRYSCAVQNPARDDRRHRREPSRSDSIEEPCAARWRAGTCRPAYRLATLAMMIGVRFLWVRDFAPNDGMNSF